MAWGEEITPLEMQNTKGGGIMEIIGAIGLIDFLARLIGNGGDVGAAAEQTGKDIESIIQFIKDLIAMAQ